MKIKKKNSEVDENSKKSELAQFSLLNKNQQKHGISVPNENVRNNQSLSQVINRAEELKMTRTFKVRGGGYLPLNIRRQEKDEFMRDWRAGLEKELTKMWKRHITVSQRYRGVMVYDGNYFDLFSHAQELYILGYYYSSIIICRSAAEQALIQILLKTGKVLDIYKRDKGKKRLKGIEQLVATCRSYSLFHNKYPINKRSAAKFNEISTIAGDLVHPKHDLDKLETYKKKAINCMDNLQYVIKNHLNFIKDTRIVSGYRFSGSATRLK